MRQGPSRGLNPLGSAGLYPLRRSDRARPARNAGIGWRLWASPRSPGATGRPHVEPEERPCLFTRRLDAGARQDPCPSADGLAAQLAADGVEGRTVEIERAATRNVPQEGEKIVGAAGAPPTGRAVARGGGGGGGGRGAGCGGPGSVVRRMEPMPRPSDGPAAKRSPSSPAQLVSLQ